MNSEPCVKFGIRIKPKISENPADSRNSRPPKVTLLTVSTNQKVMAEGFLRRLRLSQAASQARFPSPLEGEGARAEAIAERAWERGCLRKRLFPKRTPLPTRARIPS